MRCPSCQFDNREGAVFCGICGNRLCHVCLGCGAHNPVENVFCDRCGEDLKVTLKGRPPKRRKMSKEGEVIG